MYIKIFRIFIKIHIRLELKNLDNTILLLAIKYYVHILNIILLLYLYVLCMEHTKLKQKQN